jgi:hypothetical protein
MESYKEINTLKTGIEDVKKGMQEACNKLRENISIIENKIFEIKKIEEEIKSLEEKNKELIKEKEKLERENKELDEMIQEERWKQWAKSYYNIDRLNEIKFHLFLCWRKDYASKKSAIDYHKEILQHEGKYKIYSKYSETQEKFVWWGKFRKDEYGIDFEPIGEAWDSPDIANKFVNIINNRLLKNEIIYLFLYEPNPPKVEFHVALLEKVEYTGGKLPSFKTIPSCAYIPDYYFIDEKDPQRCLLCKKEENFCKLKYICNFWFKIKEIKNLDLQEFNNIINFATNDTINFAIPIMYPLVVYLKKEKIYFDKKTESIKELNTDITPISKKERGHIKEDDVKTFCEKLQKKCEFIRSIKQIGTTYQEGRIGINSINATNKDNELKFILPEKYHRKNARIILLIILDENTTKEQKVRYWKQIKDIQNEIL